MTTPGAATGRVCRQRMQDSLSMTTSLAACPPFGQSPIGKQLILMNDVLKQIFSSNFSEKDCLPAIDSVYAHLDQIPQSSICSPLEGGFVLFSRSFNVIAEEAVKQIGALRSQVSAGNNSSSNQATPQGDRIDANTSWANEMEREGKKRASEGGGLLGGGNPSQGRAAATVATSFTSFNGFRNPTDGSNNNNKPNGGINWNKDFNGFGCSSVQRMQQPLLQQEQERRQLGFGPSSGAAVTVATGGRFNGGGGGGSGFGGGGASSGSNNPGSTTNAFGGTAGGGFRGSGGFNGFGGGGSNVSNGNSSLSNNNNSGYTNNQNNNNGSSNSGEFKGFGSGSTAGSSPIAWAPVFNTQSKEAQGRIKPTWSHPPSRHRRDSSVAAPPSRSASVTRSTYASVAAPAVSAAPTLPVVVRPGAQSSICEPAFKALQVSEEVTPAATDQALLMTTGEGFAQQARRRDRSRSKSTVAPRPVVVPDETRVETAEAIKGRINIFNIDRNVNVHALKAKLYQLDDDWYSLRFPRDERGKPYGFAFAKFEKPEKADEAVTMLDGELLGEKQMKVERPEYWFKDDEGAVPYWLRKLNRRQRSSSLVSAAAAAAAPEQQRESRSRTARPQHKREQVVDQNEKENVKKEEEGENEKKEKQASRKSEHADAATRDASDADDEDDEMSKKDGEDEKEVVTSKRGDASEADAETREENGAEGVAEKNAKEGVKEEMKLIDELDSDDVTVEEQMMTEMRISGRTSASSSPLTERSTTATPSSSRENARGNEEEDAETTLSDTMTPIEDRDMILPDSDDDI